MDPPALVLPMSSRLPSTMMNRLVPFSTHP